MKHIEQFITERSSWLQYQYKAYPTTLHFRNAAAFALFKMELSGQISDGLYENAAPADHWRWLTNTTCVIDGKEGYEGPAHVKRYSLRSLISHIGKNDDWSFTERLLWFGCFGSIVDKADYDTFIKEANWLETIIEDVANAGIHGTFTTVDDLKAGATTYMQNYWNKSTLMTQENAEKFLKALETYDINRLKKDAEACCKSVNDTYDPNAPTYIDNGTDLNKVVKTADDKMDAWHNGTRKQNVKACSDEKLAMYYGICKSKGYDAQARELQREMEKRGIFNG